MQGKSLIKKTSLYFIGNLSSKIMSALIIPIYAFYIQTDDLGYYDYTQTIMAILIPIFFVAIWEAILRYLLHEPDETKQKIVIATSTGFTIFMLIIFVCFIVIYGVFISHKIELIFLVGIMFVMYAMTQIWQYYARALEENKLYVISGIIGTLINFICVLVLICILKYGLKGLFISYILGQVSIFILIESRLRITKQLKFQYFDFKTLKNMLIFSAPLVLNLTAAWILLGFGKIIITDNLGTEMNGLFAFASKFSILITMIGSVVTMAIIEEAIITAKTDGFNSEFTKIIEYVFKIFMVLTLLAVPIIKIFYAFIQDTEYYSSFSYAPWLLLSAVLITMASNVGAIFQAINKTKYQFITTVIGAITMMCTSYALIAAINVYAVILGQVLGGLAMLLSRYFLVNKYIDFKINWKPILGIFSLFIVVVIISLNTTLFINIIILILTIGILLLLNRIYLISIYEFIKNKLNSK
ncbi:oligosaccharide flippase family protein [Bacillus nitratireducens]|uniref:lipopolysaccharide biosynthesis protein n=1 Tax=Bacillus nitratireducens TaxID=2026193 RepID=UPI002E1A997F|nr:oligosaccharide flippase family protein [Bacillus nitratireducens]